MRILGIDPGTINMGYGVVEAGDSMPILAVDFKYIVHLFALWAEVPVSKQYLIIH